MWGCRKPVMQPHLYPGDKPVSLCPLTYFRDHPAIEGVAFGLHLHWSRGILPAPGGLDDQGADFALVVTAVENGVQAGRARLQEVEQKKAERKGGSGAKKASARGKGR